MTIKINNEEWMEGFIRYLDSRPGIKEIYFDLDTITDFELLDKAVEETDRRYGDSIQIYFFRSSDGTPPVPAPTRGL